MNYVVIKAGGIGVRMQPNDIPKQFLSVCGKPIIVYTLERFQENTTISEICVACLSDWIEYLWELVEQYHLTKVTQIVPGGATSHLSIRNGIYALRGHCQPEDVVVIHDAVRPIFDHNILETVIDLAKQEGAAVACVQCIESVFYSADGLYIGEHQPNYQLYRAQAPQAYSWEKLLWAYEEADRLGIFDVLSTDHLYTSLHLPQRLVSTGQHNFKITTHEDVVAFTEIICGRRNGGNLNEGL